MATALVHAFSKAERAEYPSWANRDRLSRGRDLHELPAGAALDAEVAVGDAVVERGSNTPFEEVKQAFGRLGEGPLGKVAVRVAD